MHLLPRPAATTAADIKSAWIDEYPESLRSRKLAGQVIFECEITPEGRASSVRVLGATHADFVATSSFDVMGRLGEIRVPTLVIGGEDDRWTPPKFHHYLTEHIPGARLVMFPDCGHYPFAEHPDRFNAELARFIAQLAPAAAGRVGW